VTVTAVFAKVFTLSVGASPAAGGTVTAYPAAANGAYVSGTKVCLTATAVAGWQFVSWSGATLDASNCLTVLASANVQASFAQVYSLALTVSPANAGVLKASPAGPCLGGTKVCLTVSVASGWKFISWSGASLDAANCLIMNADTTVQATFAALYTLTLLSSPAGAGTVTASPAKTAYFGGTKVCLTAVAAPGWRFASWSGATLDSSNCLTMTATTTVTVAFTQAN
jgi:hypothetical protein